MSTNLHLGTILMAQGRLKQVYEMCQEMLIVAEARGVLQTEMAGCLYDELGLVLCEWNDLDKAVDNLKKGSELSERGYDVGVLGWSYLTMMRALYALGDVAAAEEIIRKMDKMERELDVPPWYTSPKEAWKARLLLMQGKLDAATHWVQDRGLEVDGELPYIREEEYIALARILLAQNRIEESLGLMERLLKEAEMGGRLARVIEILMIQAVAYQARGDTVQAMASLGRTLTLAEPGGYVRIFVDEGKPMAELLRQAASSGIAYEYISMLLLAFEPGSGKVQPTISQPLVEPLTERELEVLTLLASELSGPEIAREITVSVNTLRTHTKNIYSKLNVNNRRTAVWRAEELELL